MSVNVINVLYNIIQAERSWNNGAWVATREAFFGEMKRSYEVDSPRLAWYPSPMRWGYSSRPKAAAMPEESYRVQSSKQRWQKAVEREKTQNRQQKKSGNKKKVRTVCAKNVYIQDPIVTLMRQKLLRAHTDHMCDWKRHAFRDIHMQSQNQHGTKRKNKIRLQQRYRPGVGGSTPWPPEAFWACSWRGWRWGWVGAVRAPFLLANHLRGWGRVPCSAAARQSWPFHTQPQNPSIWPHTPHTPSSLTLSLQVPIPSLLP